MEPEKIRRRMNGSSKKHDGTRDSRSKKHSKKEETKNQRQPNGKKYLN